MQIGANMKLLVCVDLSAATQAVVEYVQTLATQLSAKICVLHVTDSQDEVLGYGGVFGEYPIYIDPKDLRQEIATRFRLEHQKVQEISHHLQQTGLSCLGLLVNGASVVSTILKEAEKQKSDMIIVGAEHKGLLMQFIEGSTSKTLINQAPIPVLVVPVKP